MRCIMTQSLLGVFAALAIAIAVICAGIIATVQAQSGVSQSVYGSDANTNGTKDLSGKSPETDSRSMITAGCLFVVLVAIVAAALYRTREKKCI